MDGMKHYRVTLIENFGFLGSAPDNYNTLFECWADNVSHAIEQAENAYPDCDIISVNPTTED